MESVILRKSYRLHLEKLELTFWSLLVFSFVPSVYVFSPLIKQYGPFL